MDQQGHGQFNINPYQGGKLMGPGTGGQGPSAYQNIHQQQQEQLQHQLRGFWAGQQQEIERTNDFKNHSLPLARIKKIMKADEDVRMISAEAPVVFARACEMFVLELTLRSWAHTEENKRRTLQKNDIAAAITRTDIFDFLVDIVPREDLKDEVLAAAAAAGAGVGVVGPRGPGGVMAGAPGPAEGVPYYYVAPPQPQQVGPGGMIMGKPVMDQGVYGSQGRGYVAQPPWPHQHQGPHE